MAATDPQALHQRIPVPGDGLDAARMPGHWLLARLGKRVLRPGGVELTRWMLDNLALGPDDRVVELAAGLGATARLTLARNPGSFTAVDRDPAWPRSAPSPHPRPMYVPYGRTPRTPVSRPAAPPSCTGRPC